MGVAEHAAISRACGCCVLVLDANVNQCGLATVRALHTAAECMGAAEREGSVLGMSADTSLDGMSVRATPTLHVALTSEAHAAFASASRELVAHVISHIVDTEAAAEREPSAAAELQHMHKSQRHGAHARSSFAARSTMSDAESVESEDDIAVAPLEVTDELACAAVRLGLDEYFEAVAAATAGR